MGTAEGDRNSRQYNEDIRDGTIRIAMLDQLKKPPRGFEDVTRNHFLMKRSEILAQLDTWALNASTGGRGALAGSRSESVDKLKALLKAL